MKNIFKQFVVWATPSDQSKFKRAVITLTVYYTILVFIILAIFNLMVYGLFTNSIRMGDNEAAERTLLREHASRLGESGIQEMQDNLLNILLYSDVMILLFTLVISYISSKKTLAPLETAYKKQTMFVANAAHELRTPLAVMKAGSEVILRSKRNIDEYEKFIKESLDEIERLTILSNDLLFLAHNSKKKVGLISKISFSEICKKQIEIMKAYALTKSIKINDSIENDLMVNGVKDDLTRLIINLLKNAIDYNKKEGQVTLSLKRKGNNIILSIEDTGVGIKENNIPYIFERFYKTDDSRTENSSGAGLGLSIVKEIVDEHNGLIEVHSKINIGTIFIFTIPCV